jgi:hypothetical protein
MPLKVVFILLLHCTYASVFAQSQQVPLSDFAFDEKAKKLQAIVAVYKYPKQQLEDPRLNGVESKQTAKTFTAVLPDLKGARDTCYAYFYYGGVAKNSGLQGYVLAILTNNNRGAQPCNIWIDRNYNLDLTDDGPPILYNYNTPHLDIVFENSENKDAKYTVRISRFPFNYNSKYLAMLDEFYKEGSGTKLFSGAFYSFKEERLNVKAGDYLLGNDSFRIALKDVNCNGIYNEVGVDQVIIGDYKNTTLLDQKIPIGMQKGLTYFEKNGKRFIIGNIDGLGKTLLITIDSDAKIKNALKVGKRIKRFKFKSTEKEGKKIAIHQFKKKPTYIYVWRVGEKAFENDTAALRVIQNMYADKVNLVTLNYGETPKELKSFKKRNRINWLIGYSSSKINKKLFIEKFPTGILTKKRLRVKQIGLSAVELLNLLQNNTL